MRITEKIGHLLNQASLGIISGSLYEQEKALVGNLSKNGTSEKKVQIPIPISLEMRSLINSLLANESNPLRDDVDEDRVMMVWVNDHCFEKSGLMRITYYATKKQTQKYLTPEQYTDIKSLKNDVAGEQVLDAELRQSIIEIYKKTNHWQKMLDTVSFIQQEVPHLLRICLDQDLKVLPVFVYLQALNRTLAFGLYLPVEFITQVPCVIDPVQTDIIEN